MRGLLSILFTLALVAPAAAQFGGFKTDQPFLAADSAESGAWSPSQLSGIMEWWVSSDLPANLKVTNWTSRIRGTVLGATLAALQPTNSTAGVYFSGANFLTNTTNPLSYDIPADASLFFIFTPITPNATFSGLFQTDNSSGVVGGYGFFVNTGGVLHYGGDNGNGTVGNYASGTMLDWVGTLASSSANKFYTNGVLSLTNANAGLGFFGTVGSYRNLGSFFKGYIAEIGIITNVISAGDVAKIHTYATNKYSFTP